MNEEKHRHFPGNYSNQCGVCKEVFYGADKLCFLCSDCIDKGKKPNKTQALEMIEKAIKRLDQ